MPGLVHILLSHTTAALIAFIFHIHITGKNGVANQSTYSPDATQTRAWQRRAGISSKASEKFRRETCTFHIRLFLPVNFFEELKSVRTWVKRSSDLACKDFWLKQTYVWIQDLPLTMCMIQLSPNLFGLQFVLGLINIPYRVSVINRWRLDT